MGIWGSSLQLTSLEKIQPHCGLLIFFPSFFSWERNISSVCKFFRCCSVEGERMAQQEKVIESDLN